MSNNVIEQLLLEELEREKKSSRMSYIVIALLILFVLIYVSWLGSRVKLLLDAEGLAYTATGLAVESAPDIRAQLEATLVDGAPDIAHWVSEQIVSSIPAFRLYIEEQVGPVVDEAAREMVEAAVVSLTKKAKDDSVFEGKETAELANALIAEFETGLELALDEEDDEGSSPRKRIAASLESLTEIDRELQILAKNRALTPTQQKERELLIEWLQLIVSMEGHVEAVEETVETGEAVPEAAAEEAPQ